jgi:ABC-type uncharacterized transport system substrate-binding protein
VWEGVKRLSLGVALIALASLVLLLSDWSRRRPRAKPLPSVALFQIASRPVMDDCAAGVLAGLARNGLVPGRTVAVQRFNAENDLPTANSIAKTILAGRFNLVVTVSTPCLQVMANANRNGAMTHIFGAVTDPFGAGVGINRGNPLDHPRHLVGVGTFQPVEATFRLAKRLFPELKVVGEVWNPAEACSEACTRKARAICGELGITLLEAPVDNTAAVREAAESLSSRGVQALWIGGDNTVELAATQVVDVAARAGVPLFASAPTHATVGAAFALGADYARVGELVGDLAARVLRGLNPATVPIEDVVPEQLALNLDAMRALRIPWTVPDDVRRSATIVIDHGLPTSATGTIAAARAGQPVAASATTATPAATVPAAAPPVPVLAHRVWTVHFLNYMPQTMVEDCHRGFFDELPRLGVVAGRDCQIRVSNAQGDAATLAMMVDAAIADRADLILLTSTPTLQAAVQKVKEIPVVFSVVANPMLAGVGKSFADHLPNVTGISTMSDYAEMARVVRECLPDARRVGTLFATNEDNSIFNKDSMEAALRAVGIELISQGVTAVPDVPDAALSLTGGDIAALCQVNSNALDAAFASITAAARRDHKPLFAFTSGQAKKGGAAVAVARDYEQAGRDMARLMVRIMSGVPPSALPIQLVSRTRIVVNRANAALCGLTLPESLLRRADEVLEN